MREPGACDTRETVLKRDGSGVVTNNVNQSKGDQDPSTWQPSRTAYRCTCAKAWIAVKYYWNLKLQSAEKTALTGMLSSYC
jgi:hypothetical protein